VIKKASENIVEKIKTPTLCQINFSENCTVYYVVRRNKAEERPKKCFII
jgi:hypothetical protein